MVENRRISAKFSISLLIVIPTVYLITVDLYYSDFQYLRQTRKLSVNYFVKKDFEQTYKRNEIKRLEGVVEDEYIDFLRGNCYSERMNSK